MTDAAVELIESPWNVGGEVFAAVSCRGKLAGNNSHRQPGFDGLNLAQHVGDTTARVEANREKLAAQFPGALEWHWLEQVHGVEVANLDSSAAPPKVADAAISSIPKRVCGILTADCLPVFFYSRNEKRVAVAHAGWRGLAGGVLEATLGEFAGPASQIRVWLGPAIGPCHFEVGGEVREIFLESGTSALAKESIARAFVASKTQDKFQADLYALASQRLVSAGVREIEGGGLCTFCDPERFYSYRREPVCGRMLSMIYIK